MLRGQAGLVLTPDGAGCGDIGTLLFGGMRGLFLRVRPWARKKRLRAERLTVRPSAAKDARNSSSVASQRSPTSARTRSSCAAKVAFFQPPDWPGARVPWALQRCINFTTKLMLTS
jgi:hypothetical protein